MNDITKEILSKLDIVDVVSKYIPLTKHGKNYWGICPFHDDTNPSMSVSQEKQIFTCFVCKTSGNAIRFLQEYNNLSYVDALKEAAAIANVRLNIKEKQEQAISPEIQRGFELNNEIVQYSNYCFHTDRGKTGLDYLNSRQYSLSMIDRSRLGYIADFEELHYFLNKKGFSDEELIKYDVMNEQGYSKWNERVLYPICDTKGNIHGFTARTIHSESGMGKYINSKESSLFHKNELFYNSSLAIPAIRRKQEVILMEGSIDVDKAFNIGVENTLATLGTALTKEHVAILKKMNIDVRLCYDGDKAGQNAVVRAFGLLKSVNIEPKVTILPYGMDPDSVIQKDPELFHRLIQEDNNYLDFRIKTIPELATFKEKNDYVLSFLTDLSNYHDELMANYYIKELSLKTGFDLTALNNRYRTLTQPNRYQVEVKKNNSFAKSESNLKKKTVMINFKEIKRLVYKDEVHTKYDNPNTTDSVIAFDEKKQMDRSDVLRKYINQKGRVLETLITCIDDDFEDIEYKAQPIVKAAVAAIAEENGLYKEGLQYMAFFHTDTKHPHIHLQIWEEEPSVDKYKLTNHLLDLLKKKTIDIINRPTEDIPPAPEVNIPLPDGVKI